MNPADPINDPIVKRIVAGSFDDALFLYVSLVQEGEGEKADTPALALREMARAGRLDHSHIDALALAVELSPNALCTGHLAKAVAAFGRDAQVAAAPLAEHVMNMMVRDDCEYWSFDGSVWALGYLGGPDAKTCIHMLANESPSRAVRSQSIYRGSMSKDRRAEQFDKALAGASKLCDSASPGVWRQKFMEVRRPEAAAASKPQPKLSGRPWEMRTSA